MEEGLMSFFNTPILQYSKTPKPIQSNNHEQVTSFLAKILILTIRTAACD
jgi:hypothetical protein